MWAFNVQVYKWFLTPSKTLIMHLQSLFHGSTMSTRSPKSSSTTTTPQPVTATTTAFPRMVWGRVCIRILHWREGVVLLHLMRGLLTQMLHRQVSLKIYNWIVIISNEKMVHDFCGKSVLSLAALSLIWKIFWKIEYAICVEGWFHLIIDISRKISLLA